MKSRINLILHHPSNTTTTIDLKVATPTTARTRAGKSEGYASLTADTYSSKPLANYSSTGKDTLTSTALSRSATGQMSQAGSTPALQTRFYYYFLALLNTPAELRPVYSDYAELVKARKPTVDAEKKLLGLLRIDRDLLITYGLNKARAWYETASPDAFAGYAGAVNPTYITLSRRAHRNRFVAGVPASSHGSVYSKLTIA